MKEKINTYEAMFLVDSGQTNFDTASEPIRGILTRRGAEILAIKPWDDRKLCYEIGGRKRALYILSFFKVATNQVVEIEHDCRLEERILRAMILRRDRLKPEEVSADTPATSAGHKPPEPAGAPAPEAAPVSGEAGGAGPAREAAGVVAEGAGAEGVVARDELTKS
jgi:small subunit ribosomal protein S6